MNAEASSFRNQKLLGIRFSSWSHKQAQCLVNFINVDTLDDDIGFVVFCHKLFHGAPTSKH